MTPVVACLTPAVFLAAGIFALPRGQYYVALVSLVLVTASVLAR